MARAPLIGALAAGVLAAGFGFTFTPSAPGPGPDLDCAQVGHRVKVSGPDHHGLDRDGDGIGCELEGDQFAWLGVLGLVGAGGAGLALALGRRDEPGEEAR